MNPAKKSIFLRCSLLAATWWLSLGSLTAQTSTNAPAVTNSTPEDRILVIVETSAAMQKRAENIQKLVGETVSSGLGGDMRSGDTVGMWTFNDTLYSGQFPLQRWTKATRQRVAVTMVQFLQQQRYEKAARPAVIWETLTNIVARSERITVIIVSSGNETIRGTPFDESIAQNFSKNKEAQRKANMPFVTILRAYHGSFTNFSVNMAPWPIELPEYPAEARRAPEPPAVKRAPADTSPATVPPLVVIGNTPVYATNIPVADPAPVVTATNVAPADPTPAMQQTNPMAATESETKPEPAVKQWVEALPSPVESEKAPLPVVTILVAGIALLIGIMVVFIALLRWTRRSSGESLITRTMNKRDE
jgi:hypothetical protein